MRGPVLCHFGFRVFSLSIPNRSSFYPPQLRFWVIPLRRLKVAILKWPIPLTDSAELTIF